MRSTTAQLHADNWYDRLTRDFEAIVGRPATSIREYVAKHPDIFGSGKPSRPATSTLFTFTT